MIVTCLASVSLYAQSFNGSKKNITATFRKDQIQIEQGELASNILKIENTGDEPQKLYMQMTYPDQWKSLSLLGTVYTVAPKDSIFLPCMIIPKGVINGNTKYIITSILFAEDGTQLSNNSFMVSTKKVIRWEISATPTKKIYFKNNENITNFGLNIFNQGNFDQEIIYTLDELRDDVMIMDTNENIIKNPSYNLKLGAWQDTTFNYKLRYLQGKRNYRKLDVDAHIPGKTGGERKFSLLARTTEPKSSSSTNRYSRNEKINFVKLANDKKLKGSGGNIFPLIVEANANNLFRDQTTMNLNLRGFKYFDNKDLLIYSTNLFYSTNYYSSRFLDGAQAYAGYFMDKGNVQIGTINGGIAGVLNAGKGIKGEYDVIKNHRVGAFYVRSPNLFSYSPRHAYGATHSFKLKTGKKVESFVGRSMDNNTGLAANVIGSRTSFLLQNKHNITVNVNASLRDENSSNGVIQEFGYLTQIGYSSVFFDRKLTTGANFMYSSPKFGQANNERILFNARNIVSLKNDWKININNSLFENRFSPRFGDNQKPYAVTSISNQVIFSNFQKLGRMQPGLYYYVDNQVRSDIHRRGISFRYGDFSLLNNFRYSINVLAGYNKDIRRPDLDNYFSAQVSSLFNYRNLSLNTFYNYGPNSPTGQNLLSERGINPQLFRASVQHQHVLKNDHFVIETSANYNYYSPFNQHSAGVYPAIYLFTDSGWRFKAIFGYNFSRSQYRSFVQNYPGRETSAPATTSNQNYNFGINIRKEFGIPIPWMNSTNFNVKFSTFLDLNGNGLKDKNEIPLENIVLRIGSDEVITNKAGEATMQNVKGQSYPLLAFSLDNLSGWFPKEIDSLDITEDGTYFIPFVRGVKVQGQVVVNREKVGASTIKELDLTNIKITAQSSKSEDDNNSNSKDKVYETLTDYHGKFELYLPYGDYSISMDESILGGKYKLLDNNIELDLNESLENIYVSFYIMEKRRKVSIKKF